MQEKLAGKLKNAVKKRRPAVIGFDGFIDEVVHVVEKRLDPEHYARVRTIADYADMVRNGAGLSTSMEIVTVAKKLGGNGPNMSIGLKNYGIDLTYIGTVGTGGLDPVYAPLAEGSRIIGVADPGQTDAVEFEDGKIIRCKLVPLNLMSWEDVKRKVGLEELIRLVCGAELLSFSNWSMIMHMSEIWEGLLTEVLPHVGNRAEKTLFIDFADPEKRSGGEILDAVRLLERFQETGVKTSLGLNKKEACEFAELFGRKIADYREYPLEELTRFVAEHIKIDCLVVHPVKKAACVTGDSYYEVDGPFCANPVLSTGAGDNFNAGFAYGYLCGFEPELSLMLGTATSGFYVRNGRTGTAEEIEHFLMEWKEGTLDC